MENNRHYQTHYPGLDVLRGVAILLVLWFHYFAFTLGRIGVDLFFVLSGFLITKSLLQLKGKGDFFKTFFTRRVLRIFPVYYLSLILFFVASPLLFSQKGAGSVYAYYTGYQAWFWSFTQNWLFIKHGLPPEPYLQHLWSLAVEEQFYLGWPLLIYVAKNTKQVRRVVVVIFLLALLARIVLLLTTHSHLPLYYNTLARADSLAAGAFLATSVRMNKRIPKMLAGAIVAIFLVVLLCSFLLFENNFYDNVVFGTVGYSVTALFFMLLCQEMVYATNKFASFLWLKFFGRISYGFYVYHIPVLLVLSFLLKKYTASLFTISQFSQYLIAVISALVTLLISVASFRFIEQPFLRLKNKLNRPVTKTTVQA